MRVYMILIDIRMLGTLENLAHFVEQSMVSLMEDIISLRKVEKKKGVHWLPPEEFQKRQDAFLDGIYKPLDEKVEYSLELLERVMRERKAYVSCSFGKDSMILLHLARQIDPDVPVLFANTGVEDRELLRFKDRIVKEWNLNYYESKPIMHFWSCVKKYGFPRPRVATLPNGKKVKGTPKCCIYTKERPLKNLAKSLGLEVAIIGLTYDESLNRNRVLKRFGNYYYVKKDKQWKCYPIGFWNVHDVWKYIKLNNIPVCSLYQKVERIGCITCTGHRYWRQQMGKLHPKLYRKIIEMMREMGDERGIPLISDYGK